MGEKFDFGNNKIGNEMLILPGFIVLYINFLCMHDLFTTRTVCEFNWRIIFRSWKGTLVMGRDFEIITKFWPFTPKTVSNALIWTNFTGSQKASFS